jgi:predicted DNA-binding ribbon-helix-helix protein
MIHRPELPSQNLKRSVAIDRQKTSISLEAAFWLALKEIATHERVSIPTLISRIDAERRHANLSSAVRLYVLAHYRQLVEEQAAEETKGNSNGSS